MNRKLLARLGQSRAAKLAAFSSLVVAGAARADSTAAVAAISSAQTDALAVSGALLAMGVAVWGSLFLYRKFFK